MTDSKYALRAGEQALDLPPAEDAVLRFVGHIETPFLTRDQCPRQGCIDGPQCTLHLRPEWVPALAGLADYPIIEVLYWLDRSRHDISVQNPRSDGRVFGTFALRSPVRPNPIGTALVRLVEIDGACVIVQGLDCLNGTPLLDIKPNRCDFSPKAQIKIADGA